MARSGLVQHTIRGMGTGASKTVGRFTEINTEASPQACALAPHPAPLPNERQVL